MLDNLTLAAIAKILPDDVALAAWLADTEIRGKNVKQYREYMDGQQDAKLTVQRLQQLNLKIGTKSAFTTNYCDLVVNTMVDRISVEALKTENDAANTWLDGVMNQNDFEALQVDLAECAVRDADTFLMVSVDEGKPVWTLEPAWDGESGMMVFYGNTGGRDKIKVAVKQWTEGKYLRVNFYYADHIDKYSNQGGKGLELIETLPWVDRQGLPLGVPVFHYANRKQANDQFGLSELANVIPLQDALNRTIHSMVMASEYTAFQLRYTVGLPKPESISPGAIVEWVETFTQDNQEKTKLGLDASRHYEVGSFPVGEISPFIEQCNFFIQQIGHISRTPSPEMMGSDTASGESLKQREAGLLGKVKRFQTKATSTWRQVVNFSAKVQATFGEAPAQFNSVYVVWQDADIRNESEIIANAKAVRDDIPRREYLQIVGQVFGWDTAKVKALVMEMEEQAAKQALLLGSSLTPDFSQASINQNQQNQVA